MYIRNCTSKRTKATYYMVNREIEATSSDGYRNVIGMPRCGGSSRQASKENMVTGMIADNHNC
jgi:hypothetical protein